LTLVPPALRALDRGGFLVLAGIHLSDVAYVGAAVLIADRDR
jgi:hypothetical protein